MTEPCRPHILIVEDNRGVAEQFQRALQEIGDSRIAERDEQVFAEIADFVPQVMLLDLVLEGETIHEPWEAGLRILEKIRNLPMPSREIPVIVITGRLEPEVETQCQALGVSGFLRKPVALDDLYQAVEKVLADCGLA